MKIKRQFTVNASADKLWEIMGLEFDRVDRWASDVHTSRGLDSGVIPQNAPCSGRVCETSMGGFKENILCYDEQRRLISYDAKGEKMPFFVKHLANNWTFTPLGEGKSKVDMCLEISILPLFNLLMGPMMRIQMGGVINKVVEELTYFAEHGVPHPRKLEMQEELKLQATS